MIKLIGVGVWAALVALGSSYLMSALFAPTPVAAEKKAPTYFDGLDYRSTDSVTIPMISDETIKGYILARFVYTIDGTIGNKLKVPPDPFILDEVFRRLYSTDNFDFDHPEKFDLKALTDGIRDAVNKRYGMKLVHELMVEQFDYIAKKDARGAGAGAGENPASVVKIGAPAH
ncbi:hypothetical protein LQ948_01480 [Jiella sp. MQZ9-1]|uniref:Flagellar basal body-associated protein FliL n=1 Tax=Jiella flava TaxID=2816857 RepID=A0A939FUW0_9HYPH|nr:hypothetical protein [Jiella flava]MBO0661231.1 hypothetical protein [Jiella flava]MCD2469876.1 hypothetical protein [Jiella flava]